MSRVDEQGIASGNDNVTPVVPSCGTLGVDDLAHDLLSLAARVAVDDILNSCHVIAPTMTLRISHNLRCVNTSYPHHEGTTKETAQKFGRPISSDPNKPSA